MTQINYDGIIAFTSAGVENFPFKIIYYRNSVYMVPDWGVNHDSGDEDDGMHKMAEAYIREHFAKTASL